VHTPSNDEQIKQKLAPIVAHRGGMLIWPYEAVVDDVEAWHGRGVVNERIHCCTISFIESHLLSTSTTMPVGVPDDSQL
jgi:hypothetical protein